MGKLGKLGVAVAPFAGFWLAGEIGTPPIITAVLVLFVYIRASGVTTYDSD